MNLRPGVILQARYGSTRLPGKALADLAGRSILQHCLQRAMATGVSRVVLATTEAPEDDALAETASREGALVFRGSVRDVLGRVSAAAERYALDPVLRATADNPAVDPGGAARLLEALTNDGADYACEEGLPRGAAFEAVTAAALHYAAAVAHSAYDREHVTTFIKSRPTIFRVATLQAPAALIAPRLSVTVDTHADLEWVRALFEATGQAEPSLPELIAAAGMRQQEVA